MNNSNVKFGDNPLMINDEIGHKIVAGKVIIQGNLLEVQGHTAVFEGQQEVTGIDAIIVATGYKPNYSQLDASLRPGKIVLFQNINKYMFWNLKL